MVRTRAQAKAAATASELVEGLQRRFVAGLEGVSGGAGDDSSFTAVEWLRDGGRHGGGVRWVNGDTAVFNRASVNVSQVHYDDDPSKKLGSATALSTIIHPTNPRAPSVHMHVSWTQMRTGDGYWRVMADLNPAIEHDADKATFEAPVKAAAGPLWTYGREQGDRYFYIPALKRHRGITHFYLEGHVTPDPAADEALARRVIQSAIDAYCDVLSSAHRREASQADRDRQLAYHTVYFLQVLTLDRGTTSGLLIHDENDAGIMGSLPSHIDRELLASWSSAVPSAQQPLMEALLQALPEQLPTPISTATKLALAAAIRGFYREHPGALDLQASGDIVPPTVDNHQ